MHVWRRMALFMAVLPALAAAEPVSLQVLTEHSPPGEYLGADGRVTGATADMVRELMQRQGLEGDITLLPWARAYALAQEGPDIVLFETARTAEREARFKWVGPIKRVVSGLYARADSDVAVNSLDDARQVQGICAYLGGSGGNQLSELGFTNLERPAQPDQCLRMLQHGRVELWLTSDIGHRPYLLESGLDESALRLAYSLEYRYLYLAFSLDVPDATVAAWQATLDAMKTDGTLAEYYRGHYPDSMIDALSVPIQPMLPWLEPSVAD
ncbi:substrate-binding periplasmic protein [Saccharospirillum mangrovi]|uniref:substrate-binding periplasmic protein n=1 Tax=Saccharospirillum mangrovi TaxID=2161747 RepID=UPI000D392EB2|nr:ABC transporter substrate-binding protein [Saccharospirillum mangrovi]